MNDWAETSQWTGIGSILPYLFGVIMYVLPHPFRQIAFDIFPIYLVAGIILGPLSLVTGIVAIRQINKSQNMQTGTRLAILGISLGILGIAANILFYYLVFLYFMSD